LWLLLLLLVVVVVNEEEADANPKATASETAQRPW
jgi:hypothetical protein